MSIIAAGTTTTTALSSTGNTDGTLQLQVNGTTPSVTLNTLGAIGVGSTPNYGTSGQALVSAGSTAAPTWANVTTPPAGSNTQIQFNNSGSFGASSNLTWSGSTLAVTGAISATGGISGTAGANISGAGWGVLPYVANSLVLDNNAGESRFFATGANSTTDGSFLFYTGQTDGGANERFRIGTAGQLGVAGANYGTSGQVLTSGGASAAPSWTTPASGSWVLLTTVSATGSSSYATVDNAFDSTYDMYAIVISGARPSGPNPSSFLLAQQKIGGSYQSGATYYSEHQYQYFNNANYLSYFGNSSYIYMAYVASQISFQTSSVLSMTVYIPTPYASTFKNMWWMGGYQYSGQARFFGSGGWYNDTNPLTGVRFFFDNGNMNGTFSLYGIKK